MSDLLQGKTLYWAAWDRDSVVTSALRHMLTRLLTDNSIRQHLLRADTPEQVSRIIAAQAAGLALWVLEQETDLSAVCRSLVSARAKRGRMVCICYAESLSLDGAALLVEAGAQILVSELPSLQRALPRILSNVPFSRHGFHPLTSGLHDRLPWPASDPI